MGKRDQSGVPQPGYSWSVRIATDPCSLAEQIPRGNRWGPAIPFDIDPGIASSHHDPCRLNVLAAGSHSPEDHWK